MSEEGLKRALATLKGVDLTAMGAEVENLLAIKAWALGSLRLGYTVGDRVEIVSPELSFRTQSKSSGWHRYREALAMGQAGVVREIYFTRHGSWRVLVGMDRAWVVSDGIPGVPPVRYWKGPEEECPEGFEFSKEEVKCFDFDVHWVGPV